MSAFIPLQIPPGVMRSGTEYQSKGRWFDTNLVRSYDGKVLGPVGGWRTRSTSSVTGTPRSIIAWKDSTGVRSAAIGTHSKLYAMSAAGLLTDITPVGFIAGRSDATTGTGYGIGLYGAHTYGTPRPDTVANPLPATVWDLDIWGQYLVACSHDDGQLYEYQNSGIAAQIAGAPTSCYGLVVHPKRLLIALGASGNPRKWQWSHLGDNTVWTAGPTTQAGSLEIKRGRLICARAVGDQVLMLSDTQAHAVDYVGLPYVLTAREVGDSCGAISKGCMVTTGSFAAWWSKSGFWIYDGAVRALRCDVWDDLVRNLAAGQQSKVTGFHNAKHQEIWWFYPRDGVENSHYVLWSYKYDHWYNGVLPRLAACPPDVFENPLAVGADGYVYEHEVGGQFSGDTPYARGGPIELGNGDRRMHVKGIIPDENTVGDVTVSFRTRNYPNAEETVLDETTLDSTGKADLRFSARQVELVVTAATSANWRWGDARLKVAMGGMR